MAPGPTRHTQATQALSTQQQRLLLVQICQQWKMLLLAAQMPLRQLFLLSQEVARLVEQTNINYIPFKILFAVLFIFVTLIFVIKQTTETDKL